MAYVRELDTKCCEPGCSRPATVEVFNARNAAIGKFCRRHGQLNLHRLQRLDALAPRLENA